VFPQQMLVDYVRVYTKNQPQRATSRYFHGGVHLILASFFSVFSVLCSLCPLC